jgi:formamidopyrimidine-DNA glycosylase
MPELPEVETIRRDVVNKLLNKKIIKVESGYKKIIKTNFKIFKKFLVNNYFRKADRIGKLLILEIGDKENFLLIHLKMTGQIIYTDKHELFAGGHSVGNNKKIAGVGDSLPNKHSHVIFNFQDGSKMYFNDMRKFGYLKIVNKKELGTIKAGYGIEPMTKEFNFGNLKERLKNKKTTIKAFLLNQKQVSGLGNIYVDEILFMAKVKPDRLAGKLKTQEIKDIIKYSDKILKKSIEYRGTTFSNYVDTGGKKGNYTKFLKVFGRTGEVCPGCKKELIVKKKIAGRGAHFCPKCQV